MRNCSLVLSALLLVGFSAYAQQNKKPGGAAPLVESKTPPEAAALANPVKATSESIGHGRKIYNIDCAMCHGANGDGKGDLATDMKMKLRDFRNPESVKDRTDGELFYIIKNGKGEMPAEADRAKPDDIWSIVNYIRSLSKKEAPPTEPASH
jgi:mono/diheme cytochrome c family protein